MPACLSGMVLGLLQDRGPCGLQQILTIDAGRGSEIFRIQPRLSARCGRFRVLAELRNRTPLQPIGAATCVDVDDTVIEPTVTRSRALDAATPACTASPRWLVPTPDSAPASAGLDHVIDATSPNPASVPIEQYGRDQRCPDVAPPIKETCPRSARTRTTARSPQRRRCRGAADVGIRCCFLRLSGKRRRRRAGGTRGTADRMLRRRQF